MDKRIDIFEILKGEGKLSKLIVYPGYEREDDPYEHTKETTLLNPLSIKALIMYESFEALRWKYYGNIPVGSIKVICEKKNLGLIKTAKKIQYDGIDFKCYEDDSKGFLILERSDYIIVVLEKTHD